MWKAGHRNLHKKELVSGVYLRTSFAPVEVQTEEMIFLVFMYVFDIIMEIAGEELEQSW